MRRFLALIAVPLLACLVLAACGGSAKSTASSSSSATSSAGSSPGANTAVTASGAFDKAPKVTIPKATPGNSLTVRTLIQGSGTTLTKSDALAANFVLYFWQGKSSSLKANTFTSSPTVIFVIDVLKSYAATAGATGTQVSNGGGTLPTVNAKSGTAPTVTFPPASPPSALVTKTLVKGKGAKVAKGDYVIAQYSGFIWRTKKVFGSSWSSGSPFGFTIGASPEQVIPGWTRAWSARPSAAG